MQTHRIPRRPVLADALVAAVLLASGAAQAQTPSCEQFKAKLTARLARGPGPLRVASVPSGETIPAGARVVGNCGGGQWTLVLVAEGTVPAKPAPASAPVREPEETVAPPAIAPVDAQQSVPAESRLQPDVASAPLPTPAPAATPASTAPSIWNPPAFETLMWAAGVAMVPLMLLAWRRIAYRRRYDAAGLPRGPRLR